MTSILLDTSFVQPLFGLAIKTSNVFKEKLQILWKHGIKGSSLNISDISLLECLYLLNREYRDSEEKKVLQRYEIVIPTIIKSTSVRLIHSLENHLVIRNANLLRTNGHTDYLNCLIFGTANAYCDIFVTKEKNLKSLLSKIPEFNDLRILTWNGFVKEFDF